MNTEPIIRVRANYDLLFLVRDGTMAERIHEFGLSLLPQINTVIAKNIESSGICALEHVGDAVGSVLKSLKLKERELVAKGDHPGIATKKVDAQ